MFGKLAAVAAAAICAPSPCQAATPTTLLAGALASGGLVADAAGNLYGTTAAGGDRFNNGAVFRVGDTGFVPFAASPSGVPEPATWATMPVGFGAAGTAFQRRRTVVRFA